MQLDPIRHRTKCLLFTFNLCDASYTLQYYPQNTYQKVSNANHFGHCHCLASIRDSLSLSLPLYLSFSVPYVHRNLPLLMTIAIVFTVASSNISSFVRCYNRLAHIAHRTIIIISVVAHSFQIYLHRPCSAAVKQRRSNQCMVYQELYFRWNFIVGNRISQIYPFQPCLCHHALHVFTGSSYSVYR